MQDIGRPSDAVFSDGVYLPAAAESTTDYPCSCRSHLQPDRSSVMVHVDLRSLGSAARAIDPTGPRLARGAEFTDLESVHYRMAGFLLAADHAVPAPGTMLIL